MNRFLFLTSLTALLTIASIAEAERPVLNVYYVQSKRATSLQHVSDTNKLIKATMKQDFKRKIKIRVRGIAETKSFAYNSSLNEFSHYYSRLNTNRRKWALVIAPPEMQWQSTMFVGRATAQCWRQRKALTLALVSMALANDKGQSRYLQTMYGALHELGHTLGLNHNSNTASIMHSGVLYYALNGLSFSSAEKFKGKHCLRMKK